MFVRVRLEMRRAKGHLNFVGKWLNATHDVLLHVTFSFS